MSTTIPSKITSETHINKLEIRVPNQNVLKISIHSKKMTISSTDKTGSLVSRNQIKMIFHKGGERLGQV